MLERTQPPPPSLPTTTTTAICLSICLFIYVSALVAASRITHTLSAPRQLPLVSVALQQLRAKGRSAQSRLTAVVLAEGDTGGGGGRLVNRTSGSHLEPWRGTWERDRVSAENVGEEVGGHVCV